jgi:isoleucyl-tRNA synthetase
LSEEIYLNLAKALPASDKKLSVHLERFPEAKPALINKDLESAVERMDTLVMLGRNLREKIKIKAKIPLLSMKIIHRDRSALDALKKLEWYFQDELNIRAFSYHTNEADFVSVKAKANFPVLGKRVGQKMKSIAAEIEKLSLTDLETLEAGKSLTILGESITLSDVEIRRQSLGDKPHLSAHQLISIEVDPTLNEDQVLEGLSREVMRKIQQARKNANLKLDTRIDLTLYLTGKLLSSAKAHEATLKSETLCQSLTYVDTATAVRGSHVETITDLEDGEMTLGF